MSHTGVAAGRREKGEDSDNGMWASPPSWLGRLGIVGRNGCGTKSLATVAHVRASVAIRDGQRWWKSRVTDPFPPIHRWRPEPRRG